MLSGKQLERIARDLVRSAGPTRIKLNDFRAAAPTIAAQIQRDAATDPFAAWGASYNHDELAAASIVHPKLLAAIGGLAHNPIRRGSATHAGLMHTYGYLFSWLKTPFGYKRDRWLKPTLDKGLQLPARTLRAEPSQGTLLQNLTWFLTEVVRRHESARRRQRLLEPLHDASDGVRDYDYSQLQIRRLAERVNAGSPRVGVRRIEFWTDLVRFPRTPDPSGGDKPHSLLVYSAKDPLQGGVRLLTCFPVSADVVQQLCDPATLGRRQPVRPRYNAYIPGFPRGVSAVGYRRLLDT